MYDNPRDAERYLTDSIIRHKRIPILVQGVYPDGKKVMLVCRKMLDNKKIVVDTFDKDLDYSPVPLGYMVAPDGRVSYTFRVPRRKWKQGLHMESFGTTNGLGKPILGDPEHNKSLAKTILGKFMSYAQALDNGGIFHRHFRIHIEENVRILEYKGTTIGSIKNGVVQLDEGRQYLEKYVKEVVA